MKQQTDKLDKLLERYGAITRRWDAILLEMRNINATFPASADPDGLMRRWRTLHQETTALWGEQWETRQAYRQTLRGVYLSQGAGLLSDLKHGMERLTSRGGAFLAYENSVIEMSVTSRRFDDDLKKESAIHLGLTRDYAFRKESRRMTLIAGGAALGAAALAGVILLTRRSKPVIAPTPAPCALTAPPQAAAGFEPRGRIGRGTLGEVHEAFDLARKRRVALKLLRPELLAAPAALERLIAEARAVAALSHPNIAALYSVERAGDQVQLAFEFVEGKTLQILLQERRRVDLSTALLVLKGTASALQYLHGQGLIHRDLKPANIMLTRSGAVKVLDCSVVHAERGTPPYTAPEQDQGRISAAVDLYALTVIFYEMLTGELPFKGPNFPAQKREALYTPPSGVVAGLPRGLDAFFKVALAPEPSKRFATAEVLAAAAENAA